MSALNVLCDFKKSLVISETGGHEVNCSEQPVELHIAQVNKLDIGQNSRGGRSTPFLN